MRSNTNLGFENPNSREWEKEISWPYARFSHELAANQKTVVDLTVYENVRTAIASTLENHIFKYEASGHQALCDVGSCWFLTYLYGAPPVPKAVPKSQFAAWGGAVAVSSHFPNDKWVKIKASGRFGVTECLDNDMPIVCCTKGHISVLLGYYLTSGPTIFGGGAMPFGFDTGGNAHECKRCVRLPWNWMWRADDYPKVQFFVRKDDLALAKVNYDDDDLGLADYDYDEELALAEVYYDDDDLDWTEVEYEYDYPYDEERSSL